MTTLLCDVYLHFPNDCEVTHQQKTTSRLLEIRLVIHILQSDNTDKHTKVFKT